MYAVSVGNSCTTKIEIIFIQFQLLLFFNFVLVLSNFFYYHHCSVCRTEVVGGDQSGFSFLGRHFRVDLIKWVSNVRPSTNSFFDFSDIWYVGRGR